ENRLRLSMTHVNSGFPGMVCTRLSERRPGESSTCCASPDRTLPSQNDVAPNTSVFCHKCVDIRALTTTSVPAATSHALFPYGRSGIGASIPYLEPEVN